MKTKLSIILTALVVSMIFSAAPSVFADSQLDSLVNIATQARSQVKLQLDRASNVPSDIKALYDQGNSETESLINSVKQQDVEQSKQHFLSAMRIFKQISMTFSPTAKAAAPQVQQAIQAPTSNINYKASVARMENYITTLKDLVAKNNMSVDFTNLDELIQDAKDGIAKGDTASVAQTYDDLKIAITDTQNLIKEKTTQKLIERAKSFANEYIVKIDTMINHAKELGISDDDVTKLKQVKEALSTTNDPSQIVIRVQRIITINVELKDSKNQKAEANTQTVPADLIKAENASEKATPADQSIKQEQKKETKTQISQIDKLEARLAKLEPSIDDGIQAKFDSAKSMLAKLKSQASNSMDQRTLKSLDSLIGEIENYVNSQTANSDSNVDQNATTDSSKTDAQSPTDSSKTDAKNPPDSSKYHPKQKHSTDQNR